MSMKVFACKRLPAIVVAENEAQARKQLTPFLTKLNIRDEVFLEEIILAKQGVFNLNGAEKCIFCGKENNDTWKKAELAGWAKINNKEKEVIACPEHVQFLAGGNFAPAC